MMQSHKHQEPSFQRLWRSVASGSSQEIPYPAIHAFHDIRSRGQVEIGIQKIRAVFLQSPQELTKPIPIGLGTQRMNDVLPHAPCQSSGDHWIGRCNDFLHRPIRSSPSASPFDAPLDAPQEHMETSHEVEVASLQNPVIIRRDVLNAPNTVGNQGYNATPDTSGYAPDTPSPSLRRFPFLAQHGTKEYGILSLHAPHRHQICRPSFTLESEPQPINDQEQRIGGNMRRPWCAIQRRECCGISLAHSGDCAMSAVRSTRQRLLSAHGMSNAGQSVLSRLSPSPFLPDRPSRSASHASLPTLAVSMNERVQALDFSVLCFHTQRIQDRNEETSLIFLA